MYCEITDRYFNIYFVEVQLKSESLKSVFWAPEFGNPNRYMSLLNHLNMTLLKTKRPRTSACQTEHEVERSRWEMFKPGKRMVKTDQGILGEKCIRNDDGVLAVNEDDNKIVAKSYHEKCTTEFA